MTHSVEFAGARIAFSIEVDGEPPSVAAVDRLYRLRGDNWHVSETELWINGFMLVLFFDEIPTKQAVLLAQRKISKVAEAERRRKMKRVPRRKRAK